MDIHSQAKIKFSPYHIFLILLILSAALILSLKILQKPKVVLCALEAKLCPDGSSVGRVPPNCEFASCPGNPANPSQNLNTECSIDDDCVLVNQDLGLDCCGVNECQPVDYSQDKWVAVNSKWRGELCKSIWSKGWNECPSCQPRPVNENFKAICQNGTCQKVPLSQFLDRNLTITPELSSLCLDFQGNPRDPRGCQDISLDQRKCTQTRRCVATCAYGCVSKQSLKGLIDCQAIPQYDCNCISSLCQKK